MTANTGWDSSRGSAVVDGVLRYASPSQISTCDAEGDPSTGCEQRWVFAKVERRKEPERDAQKLGTVAHKSLQATLETGDMVLHPLALQFREMLPARGAVGWAHEVETEGYQIAGLPIYGRLDSLNLSGQWYDLDRHEWRWDPGIPEVVDWKFLSSIDKWACSADEVAEQVPMIIYGDWAVKNALAPAVRLSHCVSQTRQGDGRRAGEVVKRTKKIPLAVLRPAVVRLENVVERMRWLAAHPGNAVKNAAACGAYGGCPHQAYCDRPELSFSDLFRNDPTRTGDTMRTLPPASTPAPPPTTAALPPTTAAAPPQAPASPPALTRDQLLAQLAALDAAGKGQPQLVGDAAKTVAQAKGIELPAGAGLAGYGPAAQGPPLGMHRHDGVNPPDAAPAGGPGAAEPIPAHELGTLPPEIQAAAVAGGWVAGTPGAAPPAEKPKRGRPKKTESITPVEQTDTKRQSATAPPPGAVEVGGSAAQDLADDARGETSTWVRPDGSTVKVATVTRVSDTSLHLLVDVDPRKFSGRLGVVDRLEPYVQAIADALAQNAHAVDVRCAGKDSPLAYGGWRGFLRAAVKEAVARGARGATDAGPVIEPGWYAVSTTNEVMAEAADAAAEVAATALYGGRR